MTLSPVTGALSGALVGGFFAVLGSWLTARSNRLGENNQRLWEKRCAVYEEIVADIERLRKARYEQTDPDALESLVNSDDEDDGRDRLDKKLIQARIHIFMSDHVGIYWRFAVSAHLEYVDSLRSSADTEEISRRLERASDAHEDLLDAIIFDLQARTLRKSRAIVRTLKLIAVAIRKTRRSMQSVEPAEGEPKWAGPVEKDSH